MVVKRSRLGPGAKSLARGSTFDGPREQAAKCEQCGAAFTSIPTYLGRTRYCSRDCSGAASRRREQRTCKVCGAGFEAVMSRKRSTCSDACSRKAKAASKVGERNPNYKPPAERRARWWESRGTTCACCGSGDGPQFHHVIYRQEVERCDGDSWDPRNGLTLCPPCHARHHKQLHGALSLELLPTPAFDFARELMGAGRAYEYLRRRYVGDDPRLELLLAAHNDREAA